MIMNEKDLTKLPLMELRSVTRVFFPGKENEVRALRHVDLDVERGDMIAVTGPSGSGMLSAPSPRWIWGSCGITLRSARGRKTSAGTMNEHKKRSSSDDLFFPLSDGFRPLFH